MNKTRVLIAVAVAVAPVLAGCAGTAAGPSDEDVLQTLKSSFRDRGIARLERLDQTLMQKACSIRDPRKLPAALREQIESKALASVVYPSDGNYLGNWQAGEKIAQSGRGLQYSDAAQTVAGGNCYACHQLSKAELAYGNIGPSLYNYGRLRGSAEAVLEHTWAKIWNAHSDNACSQMPRFGDAGILTPDQLRDVMALLLDPSSPVNQ